jgi:hypothetical protein
MNTKHACRTLAGASLLMLATRAFALDPAAAGADPLQVEPRVPNAAGTPCVVTLFNNLQITNNPIGGNGSFVPPAACPGPWAKVKLVLEFTGPRVSGEPAGAMRFIIGDAEFPEEGYASGALYLGSPQITGDIPTWRVERDLTDVSRLFQRTRPTHFTAYFDNDNQVDGEVLQITARVGRLVFYPPTASSPAQRRADAVFGLGNSFNDSDNVSLRRVFPRNIQQAHIDILARALGPGVGIRRSWWSCVPDSVIAAHPYLRNGFALGNARANEVAPLQGCGGGSFREVEVLIDGQLAGLAPVFPWLTSNISTFVRGTVDLPAPSVQALNLMPVRVDLTPFAGLLNNGAEHEITARIVGGGAYVSGTLLFDLDEGRAIVPGAVTRNTLAAQPAAPEETVALNEESVIVGELDARHLTGSVTTRSNREYRIEGYVDTSRGRISSFVYSNNRFLNTITYDVTSSPTTPLFDFYFADFGQKVRLSSTVDRVSRRTLGGTLLSEDKLYSTYPLVLDYRNSGDQLGGGPVPIRFDFLVHQARGQRTNQYRRGTARYMTDLSDIFDGVRHQTGREGDSNLVVTELGSDRSYLFTDSRGGCYSADLSTQDGELQTRTRGEACPNGTNGLRWWSHPDGSPDAMGWAPAP